MTRSAGTTREARCRASSSRVAPPSSEQYCLGTATPERSVVRLLSLVPSPAASTTAHVLCAFIRSSSPWRAGHPVAPPDDSTLLLLVFRRRIDDVHDTGAGDAFARAL